MIQKLGAQFLARLTGLVGLRAERVAKQEAPVLTGQLRSGIAYRRIGDFRGVVETSHITRSYAGVQERRVGYMRKAARDAHDSIGELADRAWREVT